MSKMLGQRPFTPAELALTAWYDPTDSSTIDESGGKVSEWRDKSGNAKHLKQNTGSAQMLTGTRQINGLNALEGVGVDTYMNISNGGISINSSEDIHFFWVCVMDDYAETFLNASSDVYRIGYSSPTRLQHRFPLQQDSGLYVPNAIALGEPVQTYLGRQSGTNYCTNNGGALDAGATNTDSQTWTTIGRGYQGEMFDGAMAEIIVVGGVLATEVRQQIEGYLAHKWGLA